jgi:hypothetical protein
VFLGQKHSLTALDHERKTSVFETLRKLEPSKFPLLIDSVNKLHTKSGGQPHRQTPITETSR